MVNVKSVSVLGCNWISSKWREVRRTRGVSTPVTPFGCCFSFLGIGDCKFRLLELNQGVDASKTSFSIALGQFAFSFGKSEIYWTINVA